MRYPSIANSLFIKSRKKVLSHLKENECCIIFANEPLPTNADGLMPFVQNSNFFYLTGIQEPFCAIILAPCLKETAELLFIKSTDEKHKIWQGDRLTFDLASSISGIKNIYPIGDFNAKLAGFMNRIDTIYFDRVHNLSLSPDLVLSSEQFVLNCRNRYPFHTYKNAATIFSHCRAIKFTEEIDLIKKSCQIAARGFNRVFSKIKPGILEYELEAEFVYELTKNGAQGFAYEPIIASGKNNCILHYSMNNNSCNEGELILFDLGVRYANYNSDFTRVVPVSGEFSKRQKQVYNSVCSVLQGAEELLVKNKTPNEVNILLKKMLAKEMQSLGLISDNQKNDIAITSKYFMHSCLHHIGLDTHDNVSFDLPIKSGMVFAIEPAIYIQDEGFGIRLENNYLIKDDSVENLGLEIPIDLTHIAKKN